MLIRCAESAALRELLFQTSATMAPEDLSLSSSTAREPVVDRVRSRLGMKDGAHDTVVKAKSGGIATL